jgi:hypothetical protein
MPIDKVVGAMRTNIAPLLGALLLAASSGVTAQNQPDGTNTKTVDYKLGQVWTMNGGTTATVLAIEDVRKVGRVIHIRVDNIPWQTCGNIHLTTTIEHMAVIEKMMLKSNLVLSKENTDLPQSSIEAYRMWQGEKKHEIAKAPLPAVIQAQGYAGPGICNVLPRLPKRIPGTPHALAGSGWIAIDKSNVKNYEF